MMLAGWSHSYLVTSSILARRYKSGPFEFDPFEDIAVDRDGSWHWSSNKSQMHEYVRGYFASRREDGYSGRYHLEVAHLLPVAAVMN
jgi:hypothetical protein